MSLAHTRHQARRLPAALRLGLALVVLAATFALGGASALAAGRSAGAVYTQTNDPAGNAIVAYARGADGQLAQAGMYPTGGLGSGAALGSQGAVTLSSDGRWLLAVNAGSDEVSLFAVRAGGLTLSDTVSSRGDMPISVTIAHDVVYVLNGGGAGNISGFRLEHGRLRAIAGSTQPLSGPGSTVGPAQVQFNPSGNALVVTEKNTNLLDVYTVGRDGVASAPTTHVSNGATPFGFAFTPQGTLVVSDASDGALSSYRLAGADLLDLDGPVATTETAACWVVTTANGKYAYTTNAGSNSVSGFAVDRRGGLTLLTDGGKTGVTGGHPTDEALSGNGQYLYTVNNTDATISIFRVNSDGSLTSAGTLTGIPAGAVGLAAQ
jgi:6-phosphogluconolactonase (cycloisomerase 2 family)